MRRLLLLGLCGCSSIFGLKAPQPLGDAADDAPSGDAPRDAAGDGRGDAQQCFGTGEYTVCLDSLPITDVSLGGTLSTAATTTSCATSAHWTSPNQPDACFIVGNRITVDPTVATGPRPLVLVATDKITFSGLVDLSSHVGSSTPGAGFSIGSCTAPGTAAIDNNGGGGGPGGSFATIGGAGGNGQNSVLGGAPAPTVTITTLHAGCYGGPGAHGGGGTPPIPGAGGGALYAVAGTTISLGTATIAANGAGASVAQNRWGGSGGGAGGMIVLAAPAITATSAKLVANGGGGSSGADSAQGIPGADPDPSRPTTPASGGVKSGTASGGNGFAGGTAATFGGNAGAVLTNSGGGGGGGGAGYIRTSVAVTGVTASPAIVVMP